MHELAIGRALLEQVASVTAQQRASAVTGITLQIGALSGVEPALLRTAYEQLRIDTVAEHAELVIVAVPVRIRCESCGAESETAPNRLVCSQCGSTHAALLCGDEMLIESVDLIFR